MTRRSAAQSRWKSTSTTALRPVEPGGKRHFASAAVTESSNTPRGDAATIATPVTWPAASTVTRARTRPASMRRRIASPGNSGATRTTGASACGRCEGADVSMAAGAAFAIAAVAAGDSECAARPVVAEDSGTAARSALAVGSASAMGSVFAADPAIPAGSALALAGTFFDATAFACASAAGGTSETGATSDRASADADFSAELGPLSTGATCTRWSPPPQRRLLPRPSVCGRRATRPGSTSRRRLRLGGW